MRFFNPFKPHIIEDTAGRFYIRYWNACWMYLERGTYDQWWVSTENAINRCAYIKHDVALNALREYHESIAARTIKAKRVL